LFLPKQYPLFLRRRPFFVWRLVGSSLPLPFFPFTPLLTLSVVVLQGALTESGLQPEKITFFAADDPKQFVNIVDQEGKLLYKTPAGRPMGVKETSPRYIGRPESIE